MTGRPLMGFLNIDKPFGMTSMEVVRRIRRACGVKRVGHGGTLDPIATGVVPVGIGQATRVMEYLLDGTKEYTCEVALGTSTDSYDAMGEVVAERDPSAVTLEQIESALTEFQGEILQVPPMFSALKQQGRRLYDLARAGIEVDREARPVIVYNIGITSWEPPVATVRVVCGSGFYVRSLAHDLGEAVGCGGHMKSLVRRRSGPFHIDDAISLEEAEESFDTVDADNLLYSPDSVLGSLRAVIVEQQDVDSLRNGRPLPPGVDSASGQSGERARAYSVDGKFIAILRFDEDRRQWRPDKVFNP